MPEKRANPSERNPKLRHEFVGMMFAITVGEIGLQVAALVQARHLIHYLPAYTHLFLATCVVAASWVGWSRSPSLGASQDVGELFEWPFVVLLLDMAMVVTYFILVRTVDFGNGRRQIDSAEVVAFWHVLIFGLYLAWDLVAKVFIYPRDAEKIGWFQGWRTLSDEEVADIWKGLRRVVPTVVCLLLSIWLWRIFRGVDGERLLTADLALLSVVLLFRAGKGVEPQLRLERLAKRERPFWFRVNCTLACLFGLFLGVWLTLSSRPWPEALTREIRTPIINDIAPEE